MPVLQGRRLRLEPMTIEHAPGYLSAAGAPDVGDEVFRWLSVGPPRDLEGARAQVYAALAARARGTRFAYAQIDGASGEFAGTTSYYELDPALRTLAIGHTWIGRRWWRTGFNREAKFLLLSHAFEVLGAARVVWHTDVRNERSQTAIAALGAQREGVLRKHRIRPDGSWRDTVQYSMLDDEWPAARARLVEGLQRA
ncbi:MAG: GNAT family N-acetyltransferase [Actinobacteria bacterium]|nr:GNAT family N-acetyltransferase [Actinomycetota bacterium]